MSDWLEALGDLSDAMSDEFALTAIYSPRASRPNERAGPDTSRVPVTINGIFHEYHRFAGDTNRKSDGLTESKTSSTVPSFSIELACLPYEPKMGDHIEIVAIKRKFRIRDLNYELPGRSVLMLEELSLPRLA